MNLAKWTLFFCVLSIFSAGMIFLAGCDDDDDDMTGPEDEATPTPAPPTPTPSGAWGYVSGYAEVEVSNLQNNPVNDKEVIFCLGNPDNENWVNVRHRVDSKYQIKGGLDPDTPCGDDVHIYDAQCAENGTWTLEWYEGGRVTIKSPCGSETIHIPGGSFAFREIYRESCGGHIPWNSDATVSVLEISGVSGYATDCSL